MDFGSTGRSVSVRTAAAEQHECAHRLVERCYAERGYTTGRQLSSHAEASTTVCSAFDGTATIGTIAVRFETEGRLNADTIFGPELAAMRADGLTLCEFSRLAIDHHARDSKQTLSQLFHLAYLHAYRLVGCRVLVIEVNPRHVPFYRRMLGFRVCSEPRTNPRVNAPAVLLSLDLGHAREQIERFGGRPELAGQTRTLYPFAYSPAQEAEMLARLRQ